MLVVGEVDLRSVAWIPGRNQASESLAQNRMSLTGPRRGRVGGHGTAEGAVQPRTRGRRELPATRPVLWFSLTSLNQIRLSLKP